MSDGHKVAKSGQAFEWTLAASYDRRDARGPKSDGEERVIRGMLRHADRVALIAVEMTMAHSEIGAADNAHPALDDPSVELSARRTSMSFQRTRMSADRTLMAVIRTSLALISFGFTIFQFFEHLRETNTLTGGATPHATSASRSYCWALSC